MASKSHLLNGDDRSVHGTFWVFNSYMEGMYKPKMQACALCNLSNCQKISQKADRTVMYIVTENCTTVLQLVNCHKRLSHTTGPLSLLVMQYCTVWSPLVKLVLTVVEIDSC